MLPEIKLVIAQNDEILQTVAKEMDINNFAKAIETFHVVANATLTKMIDDLGGSGDSVMDMEEGESDLDDDDDDDVCTSSTKKKKK